jgi:hypothetical protein
MLMSSVRSSFSAIQRRKRARSVAARTMAARSASVQGGSFGFMPKLSEQKICRQCSFTPIPFRRHRRNLQSSPHSGPQPERQRCKPPTPRTARSRRWFSQSQKPSLSAAKSLGSRRLEVITDAELDAAIQTQAEWVVALMSVECLEAHQFTKALREIGRACAAMAIEAAASELLRRRPPIGWGVQHTEWERASAYIDAIRAMSPATPAA